MPSLRSKLDSFLESTYDMPDCEGGSFREVEEEEKNKQTRA